MIEIFTDFNIFPSKSEIDCVELIDYELTNFFSIRSRSAYNYSKIVAQNSENHSKANFEKTVLNYNELISLLNDIINKLNDYIGDCVISYEGNMKNRFDENLILFHTLNYTVLQNETTHSITICCEEIINKAILKSLNLFHSDLISNYFLNKFDFGKLILGRNNSQILIEKYEKELYNRIEGLLINIKIDLRNMLIENITKQLKKNLDKAIIA